ncbi:helix-turn-helix domain-containing protein [Clostridium facile]|uniref:Helix-turn-helix transcriptional regulator n=1 Tax=Clostridium facile TaxID=2763035 RepID=A0ABR7INS5_9CLOT|nr:AraC family transcriptional regulator [Clostridium facile]MBC5786785.1 helix-turn-helix transcriptional regulator [Clostridium facile]
MEFNIEKYFDMVRGKISPQKFKQIFFENKSPKNIQTLKKDHLFHINKDFNVSFHYEPLVYPNVEEIKKLKPENATLHNHDFFEMAYVYSGNFYNVFKEDTILQTKEQLILLNPYVYHSLVPQNIYDVAINITLSQTVVENTFLQLLNSKSILFRFFLDSIYGTHKSNYLIFSITPDISDIIKQIVSEFFEQKQFFEQVIIAKLTDLFAQLARNYKETAIPGTIISSQPTQISDILNYIRVYYATATLESTAKQFNYSPKYLSSMIKQQTNKTFSDIIYQYKLQNACNYLINSNLPIEKINNIVGYSSTNSLFRILKREFNLSPSEYRKQYRNKNLL